MAETSAPVLHGIAPSGLWSHSYNKADSLMNRFLIFRRLYTESGARNGSLAVKSFDTSAEAGAWIDAEVANGNPRGLYVVEDQNSPWAGLNRHV